MIRVLTLVCGVFLLAASVVTAGRAQDGDKITVSANLVGVNVSVTDGRGRYVAGLTRDQFEVYDDGVRQRITHFAAGDAPVSLGVVYDMHPTTHNHMAAVLGALRRFAGGLRPDDDFFLVVFNERGSATVGFVPTAEQIEEHLKFIRPREPNSLYDAVYLAATEIRSRPWAKKALVVVSDGVDHGSRHGYGELRRAVGAFDVQLYGITINAQNPGVEAWTGRWMFEDLTRQVGVRASTAGAESALGQAAIGEMARASGGATYTPQAQSERELLDVCERVASEMRRQYTLGFYPADARGDARWHKLRVRVKLPGGAGRMRLSYREGYRARRD